MQESESEARECSPAQLDEASNSKNYDNDCIVSNSVNTFNERRDVLPETENYEKATKVSSIYPDFNNTSIDRDVFDSETAQEKITAPQKDVLACLSTLNSDLKHSQNHVQETECQQTSQTDTTDAVIFPGTNISCNCACHHTHHHHHHHTIFINGQPELTVDSDLNNSPGEMRKYYRTGVLKTVSCPPWVDGACKEERAFRNYNCNSNRDTDTHFNGSDVRRVYIPIPALSPKNNDGTVEVTLSGIGSTHGSQTLDQPQNYRHHGPINKTKKRCWNLPRGMLILIATMFVIIVSLLCGLVFFLVRGNSSSVDTSSGTTSGSSSIPPTTTVINQTSACGIFPPQYLLINRRFAYEEQVTYNEFPPENDSRILLSPRIIGGRNANIVQYPWQESTNTTTQSYNLSGDKNPSDLKRSSKIISRILGGKDTRATKFPWQASLWVEGKGITCGGSVIMRDWILTAAHCTEANKDPKKWTAYMGMSAVSEKDKPPAQSSKILKIIQHEDYKDDYTYDYDISLMKLVTPVTFSTTVQPICLPSSTEVFDRGGVRSCYISGWGATDNSGQGPPPNVLQHAQVDIFDYATCRREDWLYTLVTERMMCAGKINGSSDACQGDSGGPLSCYNASRKIWTLAGSVSWGIECGQPRHPGVYTKMPLFVDWIWISIGISDGLIVPLPTPMLDKPVQAVTGNPLLPDDIFE